MSTSKQLKMIDLKSNEVKIFSSIRSCAKYLGSSPKCIRDCIQGFQKTHKGRRFELI